LYSALMVALFSGSAMDGAVVMVAFALGGGFMLTIFPWLWFKLLSRQTISARWSSLGTRIAGLTLSATAGWGLWMGLVHDQAPWCVQPVT